MPHVSIPGVLDLHTLRGPAAAEGAPPCFVVEAPHGADRAAHFEALAAELEGELPADLRDFFFVNTDVGAWQLGLEVARRVVAAEPTRVALALRCLLPRTLVDCNRVLAPPSGALVDGLTPGLAPWIAHPSDRARLSALHARYVEAVEAAVGATCAAGGLGLLPHSYAPRSVGVDQVDHDIARRMREAWTPPVERWPLRPEVDLLTEDMEGEVLAPVALAAAVRSAYEALGIEVAENHAYRLHPITQGHALSARAPGRLLCLELRRDLLVERWTPFAEMQADPEAVSRLAAPLAEAFDEALRARGL